MQSNDIIKLDIEVETVTYKSLKFSQIFALTFINEGIKLLSPNNYNIVAFLNRKFTILLKFTNENNTIFHEEDVESESIAPTLLFETINRNHILIKFTPNDENVGVHNYSISFYDIFHKNERISIKINLKVQK
jgi:hypothetical protein